MESYFRNVSSKNYIVNGKEEKFAPTTIKNGISIIKKGGFNALIPKTRCDFKTSRKLNNDVKEKIKDLKKDYPHITGTLIYQKLSDEGLLILMIFL